MQYFQAPGVAEAELELDVEASMRRILYSGSGDAPGQVLFGILRGKGILENTVDPQTLPSWLTPADLAYFAANSDKPAFAAG